MEIRPLLLGHRGARAVKSVPENTTASFDLALASGCDGFEFDVRLSSDGQAVICHDARATTAGLEIAQASAQQLGLPLMRDVLIRYQRTAFLDIELKVPGLETTTAELLHSFVPARGFVVSSFLPRVLGDLHRVDATLPLGLICETQPEFSLWPELPLEYVIPQYRLLTRDLVRQLNSAGKKILVWTVNIPAEMSRLAEWGVDGIISDRPGRFALDQDPS